MLSDFEQADKKFAVIAVQSLLNSIQLFNSDRTDLITVLIFLVMEKMGYSICSAFKKGDSFELMMKFFRDNLKEHDVHILQSFVTPKSVNLHSRPLIYKSVVFEIDNMKHEGFEEHFHILFDGILDHYFDYESDWVNHSQSIGLTKFISQVGEFNRADKIYNPFAGTASIVDFISKDSIYCGEEENRELYIIGILRLLVSGLYKKSHLTDKALFMRGEHHGPKFDIIYSFPPFGNKPSQNKFLEYEPNSKSRTAEEFFIEKSLSILKDSGKLVMLASQDFLYRQSSEWLRKELIDNDLLELVISLPEKMLMGTNVPLALIIIRKQKADSGFIKLVNCEDCFTKETVGARKNRFKDSEALERVYFKETAEFSRVVANRKIINEQYNLSVARYFLDIISDAQPLSIVMDQIQGEKAAADIHNGLVVSIKDLSKDIVDHRLKLEALESKLIHHSYRKISERCLLVAMRWKDLKPTIFEYDDVPIYISQDVAAFTIDESSIAIDYLVFELSTKHTQKQIDAYRTGMSIPYLKVKEFLKVCVRVPEKDEQQRHTDKLREANIDAKIRESGLESEIARRIREQKEDLSIKKHNIMQYLGGMESGIQILLSQLYKNGFLKSDEVMNAKSGTTTLQRVERLLENLAAVTNQVIKLTNEVNYHSKEVLGVEQLISDAIQRGRANPELFKIINQTDSLEQLKNEELVLVEVSREDFIEVYNNILENAINHGFKDEDRKYIFRIITEPDYKNASVDIIFENNGKPFPEGMAEFYGLKWEKAGASGNLGIGGWKVKQIVEEHFGGKLIVESYPESTSFPVRIIIRLNRIIN